jgi:Fe-S cluster assembly protein SufD
MAQLAERHETYVSGFDSFKDDAAFGRGALADAREAAFDRFIMRGFPTTRDEEWRFTNIAPIAAVPFGRAPRESVEAPTLAPSLSSSTAASRRRTARCPLA